MIHLKLSCVRRMISSQAHKYSLSVQTQTQTCRKYILQFENLQTMLRGTDKYYHLQNNDVYLSGEMCAKFLDFVAVTCYCIQITSLV